MPDDSVLVSSVRPASPGSASTAYFSAASMSLAPQSLPRDRDSSASCAHPDKANPGMESTATSAQHYSDKQATPSGKTVARGRVARLLTLTSQTRTVKRPNKVGDHLGGEGASDAVRAGKPLQGARAAAEPIGRWWEHAETTPQPAKGGAERLDAAGLIMAEVDAAKKRGAIQLTANATLGVRWLGLGSESYVLWK